MSRAKGHGPAENRERGRQPLVDPPEAMTLRSGAADCRTRTDRPGSPGGSGPPPAQPDRRARTQAALYDLAGGQPLRAKGAVPRPLRAAPPQRGRAPDLHRLRRDGPAAYPLLVAAGLLRSVIKDYFLVCESYFNAIKTLTPNRIEAIDMGRRGLHNEGAELLRERLADRVEMDKDTARRLFTLICVLHIRR